MMSTQSKSVFFTGQDWRAKLVFDQVQQYVMDEFTRRLGSVKFVQVGANDGQNADPIYNFVKAGSWKGLMIEPIPRIFEQLKANHQGVEGLSFANVAISQDNGRLPFYAVQDPHSALSSFERANVMKHEHWLPNVETLIDEIEVETIRLDALLDKFGIKSVDALIVDAEGFDDMVISTIDLAKVRPKLIMFEHVHLSEMGSRSLKNNLERNQYDLIYDGYDCVAVAPGTFDAPFVDFLKAIINAAK